MHELRHYKLFLLACRSDSSIVISAIHGLNPSGGFPSEPVQFYLRDKIVISAKLNSSIPGVTSIDFS